MCRQRQLDRIWRVREDECIPFIKASRLAMTCGMWGNNSGPLPPELFWCPPSEPAFDAPQHLRAGGIQGSCKTHDRPQGRALLTPLHLADIRRVVAALECERFLGKPTFFAD